MHLRIAFLSGLVAGLLADPVSAALPAGFSDVLVTTLTSPTALAFTDDGRLLIAQQSGAIRVYKSGALLPTPAMTIPASRICNNFENGLLGMEVDPGFKNNGFLYLYYTAKRPDLVCVNRVSRFTMSGDAINPATEVALIDNIPAPNGNHNGGDLKFGPDGYLYISVGDGGCDYAGDSGCQARNDASRDEHVLLGKILRITSTGGLPDSNPFRGAGTARCNVNGQTTPGNKCQETFAWGFRNPFRIAHDPNTKALRLFINDVGQNLREEIDLAQAGGDYGWHCKEGTRTNSSSAKCTPLPSNLKPPLYEYEHDVLVPGTSVSGCGSVTGGAFAPAHIWPGFDGAYIFGDYVCGAVFKLTQSGTVWSASDFVTGLGPDSAVTMLFGPSGNSQALYYTTYSNGGQVRKIFFDDPGNDPPTALASASPTSGPLPLDVTFNATGSSDPEGDDLLFFWDFGDGSDGVVTTSLQVQYSYRTAGTFIASLRARDENFEFSAPSTVEIQVGNSPPDPTIVSPAAGQTFRVGQTVTLTGSATDPDDGPLPASALSWTVLLHHNGDHTHPVLGPSTGNNLTFTAPAPEGLAATDLSFLEIRLTARDAQGASRTVTRDFQPERVPLTFETDPDGLQVMLNDEPYTAPATVTSWEGYELAVAAPSQHSAGESYVFVSWSDGGAARHMITTPAADASYTATFEPAPPPPPLDFHTVVPCRVLDTRAAGQGPALQAQAERTFAITGLCAVPATARAVAVNMTVTGASSAGNLRIAPQDAAATITTAISFRANQTRANNGILPLSDAGTVAVFCGIPSGSVHFVLDVVGYFE
ncbi:MAG TPA: PQQ-dependent sugar dehydrogenase [Thermoanaerobaculia bacterium]|nr:PQQ-dependent sugar dehydrogenase [Thermoanaerobaculia bacterium]